MNPLAAIELLLAVDRPAGGELQLTPGRVLAARVVQPQLPGAAGKLALAGLTLEATLPSHLRAGEEVKVAVRELTPERVTLNLVPAATPEPPRAPLPEGGHVRVTGKEAGRGESGEIRVSSLAIRYEAPNLGPVDLVFHLTPGGLSLSVRGSSGPGLEAMQASLGELRAALRQTNPDSTVSLSSRRDLVRYA